MNNFYKKAAAHEGFTLVELIVVIAILAILAAVAYPAYTGYIDKARESSDLTALSSITTAVQGAYAAENKGVDLKKMTFTFATEGSNAKLTLNDDTNTNVLDGTGTLATTLKTLLGDKITSLTSRSDATTATWQEDTSSGVYKWTLD